MRHAGHDPPQAREPLVLGHLACQTVGFRPSGSQPLAGPVHRDDDPVEIALTGRGQARQAGIGLGQGSLEPMQAA